MSDIESKSYVHPNETFHVPEKSRYFSPLDVFKTPETIAAAEQKIGMMFTERNLLAPDVAVKLVSRMIEAGRISKDANDFEKRCQQAIDEEGVDKLIRENFDDRYGLARFLSELVGPFLEDDILDVGSGDGLVGQVIRNEHGRWVTLVDVVDINRTELPLILFDGEKLPLPDKSKDTVLLIGSLHHSDHPLEVLREAQRVAGKNIIIVEPVFIDRNPTNMLSAQLIDWMISRVMKRDDIPCPANLHSAFEWEKIFEERGLKMVEKYDFDRGNAHISEHSFMFVVGV